MDTYRGRIGQAGGVEGHVSGEPVGGGAADRYAEVPRRRGVHLAGSVHDSYAGRVHLASGVEEAHISWPQGSSSAGAREVQEQHQRPPVSNLRRMVPPAVSRLSTMGPPCAHH
jgi:hypothetical protein